MRETKTRVEKLRLNKETLRRIDALVTNLTNRRKLEEEAFAGAADLPQTGCPEPPEDWDRA